jgi:hypothetical protein
LCLACAQQKEAPKPQQGIAHVPALTSTVTEIDCVTRHVPLKDKNGQPLTVTLGEDVRILEQVRVGDEVVVRHAQAMASAVRKP